MRLTILLAVLGWCLGGHAVFAQQGQTPAWRIRPIQIISIGQIPADLPLMLAPQTAMHFRTMIPPVATRQPDAIVYQAEEDTSGFEVTYLIEGQNIVGFDSLAIDEIKTPEGTELAKSPDGSPRYQTSPFSQTSPDGKYCVCSFRLRGGPFGKVDQLAIRGQAAVVTATKREQFTVDLTLGNSQVIKRGPFALQIASGPGPAVETYIPAPSFGEAVPQAPNTAVPAGPNTAVPAGPPRELTPSVPATGPPLSPGAVLTNLFGLTPQDPKDQCTVEIKGPIKSIISYDFLDGADLLQPSSSWDDTTGNYMMPKPKSGKIRARITYASETQIVRLPIGK